MRASSNRSRSYRRLYLSTELTRDGAVPQFSPDGRHLLYKTGPLSARVTRVVATADPARVVVELGGGSASFSPDSTKVAYWKVDVVRRATLHELATGRETSLDTGTLAAASLVVGAGDIVIFAAAPGGTRPEPDSHFVGAARPVAAMTTKRRERSSAASTRRGRRSCSRRVRPELAGAAEVEAVPSDRARQWERWAATPATFSVLSIPDGKVATIAGSSPSFSADGSAIVFVSRTADETSLMTVATADPAAAPTVVRKGPERVDFPVLSPGGGRVAFQMMPREDWELFVAEVAIAKARRASPATFSTIITAAVPDRSSTARRDRRKAASPVVRLRR